MTYCELCYKPMKKDQNIDETGGWHIKCRTEFERRFQLNVCEYCGENPNRQGRTDCQSCHDTDANTYRGYPEHD